MSPALILNITGVAKRVNLISVRALSSGGVAAYSTIIAGVEYVVKTAAARGRPSIIKYGCSLAIMIELIVALT
jgi:hypothetical protein